jgi:hypothetical protein
MKVFMTVCLAVMASAVSPAPPAQLTGTWSGRRSMAPLPESGFPERDPPVLPFTAKLKKEGNGFSGEIAISERVKPHHPQLTPLRSIVKGTVGADLSVRFTQKFDGAGGWSHTLAYEGKLSSDGKKVVGRSMPEGSKVPAGYFDMTLVSTSVP